MIKGDVMCEGILQCLHKEMQRAVKKGKVPARRKGHIECQHGYCNSRQIEMVTNESEKGKPN